MMKRKIMTAGLAILIAFGLWVYVVTVVRPESSKTYYNIPVVLEGESILTGRDLMIVGGKNATVTMEVYGNRTDLDKINSGNITIVADLTRIDKAGEVELSYDYSFPGDVASGALSVLNRNPGTITLMVEERVSKEIEVIPTFVGVAPDSSMYIVDKGNLALDHPTVKITGPESVLAKIDHAKIEVDLTGRNETFIDNYPITLCDKNGEGVNAELVTASVAEVRGELKIEYYKDLPLTVTIEAGGGATEDTCKRHYSPETIRVSGNQKVLSKLSSIHLGTIKLGELDKPTAVPFTIVLNEGLTNQSGLTEAKVYVTFPELETKTFTVSKIQALNVPEGMEYELITQALMVTVRGPKEEISKLNLNDITITIDFADAVAGTATFKPVITIDSKKFPNSGAAGIYTVSATLTDLDAQAEGQVE